MVKKPKSKVLLVEGSTERRLIPELMEHAGVNPWEREREVAVDIVVDCGGFGDIVSPERLSITAKQDGIKKLGVIFDADYERVNNTSVSTRWKQVAGAFEKIGVLLPDEPKEGGFIQDVQFEGSKLKVGAWMMPDNKEQGMLESFLLHLVPDEDPLYALVEDSCDKAEKIEDSFKSVHKDKARVHTWLSWQDEPGAQLHDAIKFKHLDPHSNRANAFVRWFRDLFEV